MVKKGKGFSWGAAGLATSTWTGISMTSLLKHLGLDTTKAKYVCFEGIEDLPGAGTLVKYGTSISMKVTNDPSRDVMLAYMQNGELLTPDHGFPIRLVVPGYIGGRMIKWLRKVYVSEVESDNHYHYFDNRVLPSHVEGRQADEEKWWHRPEYIINDLNINSAITSPDHDEIITVAEGATYEMKGYAYVGGGRRIIRVEVSLDQGHTWKLAPQGDTPLNPEGKAWAWTWWSLTVPVAEIAGAEEIMLRAWDQDMNTQPQDITWNLMGMMNNCYFRIKVHHLPATSTRGASVIMEHPTRAGEQTGGWMPRLNLQVAKGEEASTDRPGKPYTMAEVGVHASEADCWIVVKDRVYDVSTYLNKHPGGKSSITMHGGKDATVEFEAIHSKQGWEDLTPFLVGHVVEFKDNEEEVVAVEEAVLEESWQAALDGVDARKTIVVVGNGMVGLHLLERLVETKEYKKQYKLVTFCEEEQLAYDRVGLTKYLDHKSAEKLAMAGPAWYAANGIQVISGLVTSIDREKKTVTTGTGVVVAYDALVMATGSAALMPAIDGSADATKGLFKYRHMQDMKDIVACATSTTRPVKTCAVVGGGLLGLEAAEALFKLGIQPHLINRKRWLLARQLDMDGGSILHELIAEKGIKCHLGLEPTRIHADAKGNLTGLQLMSTGGEGGEGGVEEVLKVDMAIMCAGIAPRSELGLACGLELCKGGLVVNDDLSTSDPSIYAVGEVASHRGRIYGVVAPGYVMADVLAYNLLHAKEEPKLFTAQDTAMKVKCMGVQAAAFGDYFASGPGIVPLTVHDPLSHVYKKLLFKKAVEKGQKPTLIGGMLVGEIAEYGIFQRWKREQAEAEEQEDSKVGQDVAYETVKEAMSELLSTKPVAAPSTVKVTNLDLFRMVSRVGHALTSSVA